MPRRAEQRKNEVIDGVAGLARRQAGDGDAEGFLRLFYAHVPPDDVLARDPDELCAAALSLWEFARERRPGRAKRRVVPPRGAGGRAAVEIVNDDMPFLVDSVTAALNEAGLVVHLAIHPIVRLRRDAEGRRLELLGGADGQGGLRESLMRVEFGGAAGTIDAAAIERALDAVLVDVRRAVEDWPKMRGGLAVVLGELGSRPLPLPPEEVAEVVAFLRWLEDDHFTFLGYREYSFTGAEDGAALIVPGSGLGVLRDETYSVFDGLRNFAALPPEVQDFLRAPRLLMITKSNRRATVHRPVQMDAIGIKMFGPDGEVTGQRLFLGLFTSLAYGGSARAIPLLRVKVRHVMQRAGLAPTSHDGKALQHILDTLPRDELFQIGEDELAEISLGVLNLQERQRIALFVRRDPFERFVSCLVYVPRDRYNTELRLRIGGILEAAYGGEISTFRTQLDETALARIHFVIETTPGALPAIDAADVERRLVEAGRSWSDRLQEALVAAKGEGEGLALLRRYGEAFPTAYRESVAAADAIGDIELIGRALAEDRLAIRLCPPTEVAPGRLHVRVCHPGTPIALSDVLPMLENAGARVIGEVPHEVAVGGDGGADGDGTAWLQDVELEPLGALPADFDDLRRRFEDSFLRVWSGAVENDRFNRLVLLAGLDWRQVVVLRAYCKVLRQAGSSFSQTYMEDALASYPAIAARLVALFERSFDPARGEGAGHETADLAQEIDRALDEVTNLDEDRILRSFLALIEKTLRTNYFQRAADGGPKSYLSLKLASRDLDLLPAPRPMVEIYLYSPRVEGVHLRFGKVARGGIRWSDRKEDFRTEILGLVKAQVVKNAVIVPTGSKGGFVVKRPPPASAGREAQQAEGVECYRILMRGLLDITDNIVGGKVVPPAATVRRDGDDPYLVVAADKGTATFSDVANGMAAEYGFWLGDAFASGGSAGYDHKGMGITARGAWELVKRHFRELGTDIQTTDFTVVGVGDMSGDVFGNGMLLSKHIRLLGGFDHRHIFVDPDPDAARSWEERKRLFDTSRSSWADYDRALISKGGGVFERSAKSIDLSPEIRKLFGIEAGHATPAELIRAMLAAKIDLLWFGGIGTYVKASGESNAEVGDRANDPLRIDGADIRAKVVGEGANLGVTQRGRIEYALGGGRINTDAIDNSAGVDTSDHEVNLKVLFGAAIAEGRLTLEQRNALLAEMTHEVAELVLRDNYLQGLALSLAEAQGIAILDQQARLMRALERAGHLDREIEFLPDDETLAQRAAARRGLTRPELAVLMAYAKNTLEEELAGSDLSDDPQLAGDLYRYFPKRLVKPFRGEMERHPLRREIIATFITNSVVNRGGITFVAEMADRTGRGAADVLRAYAVARDGFQLRPLWSAIDTLDNEVPAEMQYEMLLGVGRLAERATLWLLRSGAELDIRARLEEFRPGIEEIEERLPTILAEPERRALKGAAKALTGRGVPAELAGRVARLERLAPAFDIVRLAAGSSLGLEAVARVYYGLGHRFGCDRLREAASRLPADTAWRRMAAASLIDDLFALQSALASEIVAEGGANPLAAWTGRRCAELDGLEALLREIDAAPAVDLAMLTVAARRLRALLAR